MDELELKNGRPASGTREAVEEACYDFLETLGIAFTRADHEALYTMEALAPVEAALGCGVAKNLFLTNRQQTDFYLLLMPVVSCFIGVVFLNEELTAKKLLGIFVVLAGAAVILLRERINRGKLNPAEAQRG